MKNYAVGIASACLVAGLCAFTALDTFVFADVYQVDAVAQDTSGAFASAQNKLSSGSEASSTATDATEADSTQTGSTEADSTNTKTNALRKHGRSSHSMGTSSRTKSNKSSSSSQDSTTSSSKETQTVDTQTIAAASSTSYESYSDANKSITMTEYTIGNTQVYVADVQLTSAEFLKTAFAENTYGKNITAKTSAIAQSNNAVLAINGDYYGAKEAGYVIRNGVVYRSTSNGDQDVCCIYADGTMRVVSSSEYTADELAAQGVWQAFTFGPALVENGSVVVDENYEVGHSMASNPRTAIGIVDANHYLFVVSDGRTDESEGLSLNEIAQLMQSLGATCAYNLDGGGSSTMYYQGKVINNPTTTGTIKERSVSDIVYV